MCCRERSLSGRRKVLIGSTLWGNKVWSKSEIENKVFSLIKFVDAVLINYSKNLIGFCFFPKRTLCVSKSSETISPLLFFCINLLLTAVIRSFGNLYGFSTKIVNLVISKDTKVDDTILTMFGIVCGTIIFCILVKHMINSTGKDVSYELILKSVAYASFLFVPIEVLNIVIDHVFFGNIFNYFGDENQFSYSLLWIFACKAFLYFWWARTVWLSMCIDVSNAVPLVRALGISVTVMIIINTVALNLKNIERLSTLPFLDECRTVAIEASTGRPPNYVKAAGATMFLAQSNALPPYRRYCENIRAATYLSGLVQGFNVTSSMTALDNKKFETVEAYMLATHKKVSENTHTPEEHKILKAIKDHLVSAKKLKNDENYITGEYDGIFHLEAGYSSNAKGIRIIP
ncbi:hypothetical protein KP004_05555 [Geomonas oryzisoli]|uniref:Uncharacterized protein n=1 Tax=Geomonas oryzisoli TaxID=2847992 RepID=A0ABX8JAM6_9BACT|nr:hypothetical protein [Geomonas oryzisoli]QWV94649.1 hypothetical protein KP004_05555 [Geomonas oryzisoli]